MSRGEKRESAPSAVQQLLGQAVENRPDGFHRRFTQQLARFCAPDFGLWRSAVGPVIATTKGP